MSDASGWRPDLDVLDLMLWDIGNAEREERTTRGASIAVPPNGFRWGLLFLHARNGDLPVGRAFYHAYQRTLAQEQ